MNAKNIDKDKPVKLMLPFEDCEILTLYQKDCIGRFGKTLQLEQEAYLSQHPEVGAMLELLVSKMVHDGNRKNHLAVAAKYLTRPTEEIDDDIRKYLRVPPDGPYNKKDIQNPYQFVDYNLELDLKAIKRVVYPEEPMVIPTPELSTITTLSSSFLSMVTSDTTLPTPEPIPTPEPTLSEAFFSIVSNTVDKAVYLHVDEPMLRYDTAYVELMKAVEEAMEIPVIEIREDLAELLFNAFENFEADILEKERIAAEIAWEKRMRKKMKRTLRRLNNFKGYETPPSSRSKNSVSESETDRRPPLRPCVCHPQFHYNRYPKDRFGIYLPGPIAYSDENTTTTPVFSTESIIEQETATDVKPSDEKTVDKKNTKK